VSSPATVSQLRDGSLRLQAGETIESETKVRGGVSRGGAEAEAGGALSDGGEHDRCGEHAHLAQAGCGEGGDGFVAEDHRHDRRGGRAHVETELAQAGAKQVRIVAQAIQALRLCFEDLERGADRGGRSGRQRGREDEWRGGMLQVDADLLCDSRESAG